MASTLDIRNFTRGKAPIFPFAEALEKILLGWEISLVFAGETRARSLNKKLRNKEYIPNVLSFEVGKKSGEIILCPSVARKQAPLYDLTYTHMVGFLFIHGLLHLKGVQHGATMDRQEREILSQIINVQKKNDEAHRNRH